MPSADQTSIPVDQVFRGIRADAITPRLDVHGFLAARDAHLLVAPTVRVPLQVPAVLNPPPEGLTIQRPAGMPPSPDTLLDHVMSPPMTLARLADMVCIPGGVALRLPGTVLDESFNAYWEKTLHHHLDVLGDNAFRLKQPVNAAPRLQGPHLLLDFQHVPHYGHFIVDVLCRLWGFHYARDVLGLHGMRVIVSGTTHAGFVLPMLEAAGVPADHIVVLQGPVRCDDLFVATKAYQTQEYTSPLAASVWRRISDGFDRRQGGPERVYLSRSRQNLRVCVNEAAAEEVFVRHGFTIVHPQDLPVAEQVDMMANATLVAGTSGSNMFNLAFQRRLRAALILLPPALLHYSDQFLNAYQPSTISYFVGRADTAHPAYDPNHVQTPWMVDVGLLDAHVAAWVARTTH